MKTVIIIGLVVLAVIVLYSCLPSKKDKNKNEGSGGEMAKPVFNLSKSSCKGTCEVFDLTIDSEGKATYEGKKHVEMIGTYKAQLSDSQYNALKEAFEGRNFSTFKTDYTTRIADLQKFTLGYSGQATVFQKKDSPKALNEIVTTIDALIKELDWQKVE